MKSTPSARSRMPRSPRRTTNLGRRASTLLIGAMLIALVSCSSLRKPEQQPSTLAPDCKQRAPGIDSGDPPTGADVLDWMAWARAYIVAQYAVADRDNKRAATADCLDKMQRAR